MSTSNSSAPIKILYCESNIDGTVGGSFFSLLYLTAGIDKSKYEPLVAFHCEHSLLPRYRDAEVKTVIIPSPKPLVLKEPVSPLGRTIFPVAKVAQKAFNFFNLFILQGLKYAYYLKKHNIKMLHLNNSIIKNNDWMLGAMIARVKCITHERGINSHYPKMARYFAKHIDAVICISEAVKMSLMNNGVSGTSLVTIYNGIDPDIVVASSTPDTIRKRHNITGDKIVIGVIGNIKEWKGQETVIRALPEITRHFPDLICMLVGDTAKDDQYYKDRLLDLIDNLGIQDNVIFTGYTSNVADYLETMQVVLHTSIDPEPFGRVLIEAMAMKKPLIGANAGAVPEIIDDGVTGLTFPPADSEALAKAVLQMLNNPENAEQMGQKGYKRLIENFHISTNIKKTENLYMNILKNN